MGNGRGVTGIELALVLGLLALGLLWVAPQVDDALDVIRVEGAVADLYGAVFLTKAHARARGVTHALRIEPDGRGFRVVENPFGTERTVWGPTPLAEGVVASANTTIQFSPKGFAVPFGTITVRAGTKARYVIVNILGRVRVGAKPPAA
jgi:Tfp pilus assembly protein FimT